METQSKIESLLIHMRDYAEERVKLISLTIHDKVARTISDAASFLIFIVIGLFTLLFLSLALSWWIGRQLEEPFLGFLIVGGFYLLITILIYVNRGKWIRMPVINAFLKSIADEEN